LTDVMPPHYEFQAKSISSGVWSTRQRVGWFRSRAQWGSGLALFALLLGLVLSFGHLHLHELPGAPLVAASDVPRSDVPPAGHDGRNHFCDICATLQALGTGQLSAPPVLVLPVARATSGPPIVASAVVALPPRLSFRSRAPPSLS
jgi:hypothetical protein